jgi:RNA polymerase sigma-70 factor (ECF subfamily)
MQSNAQSPEAKGRLRRFRAEMTQLFREEQSRLIGKLSRIVGPHDAEDIAQTAFIRLLETTPAVEELRSIRAYLYRVAHNIAIDHVRRRTLASRIFHPADLSDHHEDMSFAREAPDAVSSYDARQTLRQISVQLDTLPAKCQQAFVLSKVEENTYPEIAVEMNLSVSMIEKYLSRALSHVRNTVPYEMAA